MRHSLGIRFVVAICLYIQYHTQNILLVRLWFSCKNVRSTFEKHWLNLPSRPYQLVHNHRSQQAGTTFASKQIPAAKPRISSAHVFLPAHSIANSPAEYYYIVAKRILKTTIRKHTWLAFKVECLGDQLVWFCVIFKIFFCFNVLA